MFTRAASRSANLLSAGSNAAAVGPTGGKSTTGGSTTGTQVIKTHGEPDLSLSPGRIDPTNPVWNSSRKPLVGEFTFNGKPVFVIAHILVTRGPKSPQYEVVHINSEYADQVSDHDPQVVRLEP